MKLGVIWIQYHRMPKYIGSIRTTAPSHLRIFRVTLNGRWKYVADIPMPKYGRQ